MALQYPTPNFPVLDIPGLDNQPVPSFYGVRVRQPELPALTDIETSIDRAMDRNPGDGSPLGVLKKGARVAVAVGSRGIANLPTVVRRVVDRLKDMGFAPFIVPAMGSHGGGVAEGQVKVLAHLGVSEEAMGVPVVSSMETVNLGEVEPRVEAHIDRNAYEADGIVVVARVKAHTNFEAEVESGLCKMISVGLGKAMGARNVHIYGRRGLVELMPRIAEKCMANARFVLAVALVENSHHELAVVEGVDPADFVARDKELLALYKAHAPAIPFAQVDNLVVEWLGKNISGTGMDIKTIGREGFRGDPMRPPYINSIVALRVTPASAGNGIGVGNADFMPLETAQELDLMSMYFNALTSACMTRVKLPPVLPTEKLCIQAGLRVCWQPEPDQVRGCVLKSTSDLDSMLVTRPLLEELEAEGKLVEVWRQAEPLRFDDDGKLVSGL
ncbi:DUF362 domain-containing protein [Pseudodesulfovibrio cashew]|uniref:DUF362 domain-containing protein n=1 Tax=Pseudodesulfovibrio cashew TaxID=2678688 RepID=A0A6I6JG73_9BACT|nr:DUF362 domain-containing protein [Pseudodesulfovibrio cashew]QGY41835.1 DUF362 domain-containing protein [Pseudodesulfovibrio cashew]